MVLGAEANAFSERTTRAFGTPTIVHFSAVLLISAILTAPWHALEGPALGLGAFGLVGVVYGVLVVFRARRQTEYVPVLEDWICHWILPLVAYTALLTAAIMLPGRPTPSLFGIGASALLLLFVGIHNAWDAVTYIALRHMRKSEPPKE